MHDLQLQTLDGRIRLLRDGEYTAISQETSSFMPAFSGTPKERRDLIAFPEQHGRHARGPCTELGNRIFRQARFTRFLNPPPAIGRPTPAVSAAIALALLTQINAKNIGNLKLEWNYSLPYFGLETTPLVMDGVMYVTGPNQVSALDGRSGREIWHYSRPRTEGGTIAGDAAKGANRGVAMLGDRLFFITDNAHLICLHRLTGAVLWEVSCPKSLGITAAPPRRWS